MPGNACADSGSHQIKSEDQAVIRHTSYQCDKIDGVYPAPFGGSVTMFCYSVYIYIYIIRDKGGRYNVKVDD